MRERGEIGEKSVREGGYIEGDRRRERQRDRRGERQERREKERQERDKETGERET